MLEDAVCAAVEYYSVILTGVSIILSTPFISEGGLNNRNTSVDSKW